VTRSLRESLGNTDPIQWARDFLAAAGFPMTPANLQAVYSWMVAESGGGGGMWNPLNTTQGGYAGESDFNSVGVKNYARRADGIAANARVIHNGFYPRVVALFTAGTDARATCDAITSSPWGTGRIVLQATPVPIPPTPPPEVQEMQVIALPQHATPAGRDAIAVWDPAHPNRVVLENGARIRGDQMLGPVRVWTPRDSNGAGVIPDGVVGVGITARHGGIGNKIVGVVLVCTRGNTYFGELP
jgi:hypothetical protein